MKIGYARVSTQDQNLDMQITALEKFGCEKIFKEKKSAVKERPELEKMIVQLRKGDIIVVFKLDRLGRSLKHLIDLVNNFREKGVEFISLNDNIDTTTAQGRFTFNMFASFAEFERELIKERTIAGLEAARERGRVGGRKKGLSKEAQTKALACYQMYNDKSKSIQEILTVTGVSKSTFYRNIKWVEQQTKKDEK